MSAIYPADSPLTRAVRRWRFRDVHQSGPQPYGYTFEVNPNSGGSPQVTKQMSALSNTGPGRAPILQEGQSDPPTLQFSGVILTQAHYEALEDWYDRKILLELTDDLRREFTGVLTGFAPDRIRRPFNEWYHTYSATFAVYSYRNASGRDVYGRSGYTPPAQGLGPNLLTNPSFEEPFVSQRLLGPPPSWQQGADGDNTPQDHIIDVVETIAHPYAPDGRQVLSLYQTVDPSYGLNSFMEQIVRVARGRWLRCSASYYADGPIEPAYGERGLMLSVTEYEQGAPHHQPGHLVQANEPINAASPSHRWERLTTRVYVPFYAVDPVVQVRLYCPGTPPDFQAQGERTLYNWDHVTLQQE